MNLRPHKPRLAIISPFIDKKHGTERRVAEWIAQLSSKYEIHIYSQDVHDVDLDRVIWHRIPKLPGPHIFNFSWWVAANSIARAWHTRVRGLCHDIVFSAGINCLNADAVSVHIVFAEYIHTVGPRFSLRRNPLRSWPRLIHRRLYYRLVIPLERHVFRNPNIPLILIARRTASALKHYYGRGEEFPVVYGGLDHDIFNPGRCSALRESARRDLKLTPKRFSLVVVGNDGQNKGFAVIFKALSTIREMPIDLLVVTREDPTAYLVQVFEAGLDGRIYFLPPRSDIEFYYAAADAYVGPSLEDAYAQPPAEAMACGLPVIVSAKAGVSEIITDGQDGLILADPTDATALAAMIRRLYEDKEFSARLGKRANETAQQYTWERNGRELKAIFEELLKKKSQNLAETVA